MRNNKRPSCQGLSNRCSIMLALIACFVVLILAAFNSKRFCSASVRQAVAASRTKGQLPQDTRLPTKSLGGTLTGLALITW
ncbi:hypothetical protein [Polycladidibacter stylochi]|uniref:hypothetical protein n=1 Tax=Polycladidibacter stylochi TaxID=1807766 RepID=UPI000A5EA9B5|nr:hypothetical protein [Pseudovibrio stylochi]